MAKHPSAFGYLLSALDFYLSEPKEIAIVGELGSHEVRGFLEQVYSAYLPNKVMAASSGDALAAAAIPLLADRVAVEGKATVYVCKNYTCLAPAVTTEELAQRLAE